MTEDDIEQRVRVRAYHLWEEAGRPHGQTAEFWERARSEIESELIAEQDEVLARAQRDASTKR